MTPSDVMWRWWTRVTVEREFPAPRPLPAVTFDQIVFPEEK